ncbi:MAG: pyruvate dehydrogenase (acetyl-transferring) E1 component subunit alpha [Desulfobacterales bacterium]|nr:pyruvate dehydrogenase (acetyl-transferring) E1 component subunit alpha [Desulfobacterales bacterium]
MPRTHIELDESIERLSILDAEGNVDKERDPDINRELLLKLYRAMVLGRRFDERLLALQRQGRIGTFPPISGQEAAHLGAVAVLQPEDWMVPAFRETAAEVWRGRSLESVILGNAGFNEAAALAPPGPNLPVAVPVGSQMLHAVGLGWAARYRGKDQVVLTFFGDGATSEGDFHEAMNFAGVYQAPVIFVCQNNQWAISIPRHAQTRSATIAQKALAYGMPGIQVDGNDVLAVYAAVAEAAARARAGNGPTLVECETYRMMMHTTADDPKRYRTEEEVEGWRRKDPILRFETYLKRRRLLTKAKIEAVDAEVREAIQTAVDAAETRMASLGDPIDMFDHAYAEMTPAIAAHREEFLAETAAAAKEGSDA